MEHKNVFYACVYPFLAFFTLFALVIYPNRGFLHPHGIVDMLASHLPTGFSAPLSIIRNWSFALFYVMAEMWGSVVTSVLFWGFANEVTTVDEAKKYCTFRMIPSQLLQASLKQTRLFLPWYSCLPRPVVWDGCKRCSDFFWPVCQMGFKNEKYTCSRRRRLGRELEVFDGGRGWKWGCPTCGIQVHAR